MNLTLRKPKTWPYAASSTGRPRGALPLGSRSIFVFEAIGKAREEYNDRVHKGILEYLKVHAHELQTSGCVVLWSLYMMGRSAEKTKPMVMFMSDDKKARAEAFELVKKSGIMKEFPGFEIGHMALKDESEHLRVLGCEADIADRSSASTVDTLAGTELPEVFASKGPIVGARLQVRLGQGDNSKFSQAVAGGIVQHKGTYYIHTVGHFLLPTETEINTHDDVPATGKSSDSSDALPAWDATGLSDFEDDSDDDVDPIVEATSRGSATPESSPSDSCSLGSVGSSLPDFALLKCLIDDMNESESTVKQPKDLTPGTERKTGHPPSTDGMDQDMVEIGRVAWLNKTLDSAFIKLDMNGLDIAEAKLREIAIPAENLVGQIGSPTADSPVQVSTTSGGSIHGTLSGTHLSLRLPHSTTFQTAYAAMLNRPLAPGDCGTWVKHAVTGKILGYVVAGSPTTGLFLLLPASNIVESFPGLRAAKCDSRSNTNLPNSVEPSENTCGKDRLRFRRKGRVVPRAKMTTLEVDEPLNQTAKHSLKEHIFDLSWRLAAFILISSLGLLWRYSLSSVKDWTLGWLPWLAWEQYIPVPPDSSNTSFAYLLAYEAFLFVVLGSLCIVVICAAEIALDDADSWLPRPRNQHELLPKDRRPSRFIIVGLAQLLLSHGTASGTISRIYEMFTSLLSACRAAGPLFNIYLACLAIATTAVSAAGIRFINRLWRPVRTMEASCGPWVSPLYLPTPEGWFVGERRRAEVLWNGGEKNNLEYILNSTQRWWKTLPALFFGVTFLIFGNHSGNSLQFGLCAQAALDPVGEGDIRWQQSTVIWFAIVALTASAMLNSFSRGLGPDLSSRLTWMAAMFKIVMLYSVAGLGLVLAFSSSDAAVARLNIFKSPSSLVMALLFFSTIDKETNSMTSVGRELAKEGVLPFRLSFAHSRDQSVMHKLDAALGSHRLHSPAILTWALNVFLVWTVGRASLGGKPGYSLRVQFLAFLTEALINVITTPTRPLRAPPLVVRKDGEYHMDLVFFRKPPHLRLFGRLLGYVNGVVAVLKDRLGRFTGLDRWRLRIVRHRYVEVDENGDAVQKEELVEFERGLSHSDFQRICEKGDNEPSE